eukprot:Hpha_TRINITY_DN15556_c1_g4::TRINITY_DN15556_c1_g4_i9::g.106928::m.106928
MRSARRSSECDVGPCWASQVCRAEVQSWSFTSITTGTSCPSLMVNNTSSPIRSVPCLPFWVFSGCTSSQSAKPGVSKLYPPNSHAKDGENKIQEKGKKRERQGTGFFFKEKESKNKKKQKVLQVLQECRLQGFSYRQKRKWNNERPPGKNKNCISLVMDTRTPRSG